MKTKRKRTIRAVPNFSKRTFTIRTYFDGKIFAKYRTLPLTPEEFESELNNTENDWRQFLKTNEYYKVKLYL